MKQETNNEMDLLLRRLARRQETHAPDAEDHLDADELSAYAENALPVKTRARYTEHLAECSRCREFVVQLSASAGVVIAAQADKVPGPAGLRKFLAGFFSPMVLRYAAPALGLIVVAAIGFVMLRGSRRSEYVSQIQNQEARPAGAAARTDAEKKDVDKVESSPQLSDSVNKETATRNVAQQPTAATPQGTPAAVEQNAPAAKAPAPKPAAEPVTVASEPPPPATASVDVISENKQIKNEDAEKKLQAEIKVAPADDSKANFEAGREKRAQEPATARSRVAKSKSVVGDLSSAQGAAAAPAGSRRDEVDRAEKDSSAETKSVAGKQFRKQKGIWVDTAYDNSGSTTNYTRNTESYRSLIADEPGIKTIADQLDGEFVIVWKGRAYRIR